MIEHFVLHVGRRLNVENAYNTHTVREDQTFMARRCMLHAFRKIVHAAGVAA